MFAKLVTVIVVLGAMFGALLVNRQERIDTAAEISRIHFKLEKHDRDRTRREAEVAKALTPARIRELLDGLPGEHASKPVPFRADPSSATEDALGEVPQLAREAVDDGISEGSLAAREGTSRRRASKERGG